jgi:hypothetical protein
MNEVPAEQKLMIPQQLLDDYTAWLMENPNELFYLSSFRKAFAQIRKPEDKSKIDITPVNKNIQGHALKHNVAQVLRNEAEDRPELFLGALRGLYEIQTMAPKKKVLDIGPRSESEIFTLWTMGFNPLNIEAVDLMTYSPLIKKGDAHNLQYEDDTFDLTIAGWVFAYSSNNQKMADELIRVTKNRGVIAVGCNAEPRTGGWEQSAKAGLNHVGGMPHEMDDPEHGGTKVVSRFWCTEQIQSLFSHYVDEVLVNFDYNARWPSKRQAISYIFRVGK